MSGQQQQILLPTYSFDEAFELIQQLDWQGLDVMDEHIHDEEARYDRTEFLTLIWLIDLMYEKKMQEVEDEL